MERPAKLAGLLTDMRRKHPDLEGWEEIFAALKSINKPPSAPVSTAQLDAVDYHRGSTDRSNFELANSTSSNWAAWYGC